MSAAPVRIPKAERTRRQILAAAVERFAATGFEKTRLEDVAEDVGLVGSAILYHYKDKRELYRAVLDDLFTHSAEEALAGEGSVGDRLEAVVRALVRSVADRPAAASIMLRETMSNDPDLQERMTPVLRQVGTVFAEGVRNGDIKPVRNDPYHLISGVVGAVLFYVAALPRFLPELPPDHLAPEQMQALERDVVAMTRRLLGTDDSARPEPSNTLHSVKETK